MGEVVLSGIRATGSIHFGNFLGAIQNFVRFQTDDNLCMYFIADYHTLTTLDDPEEMRKNLVEIVKDYLAAGLDPEKSILYAQSSVPEIAELSLYLSMISMHPEVLRLKTVKEMRTKMKNKFNVGIINYPVLMAADILGAKATLVPVGEDQVPNGEFAKTLARRFNKKSKSSVFTIPKFEVNAKVPGLTGGKMGKSASDDAIDIKLPPEEIRRLYLTKGDTDPGKYAEDAPGDPLNACVSVYPVHLMVTPGEKETNEIAKRCQNGQIGCVECKNLLADSIAVVIAPFQSRRAELADKDDTVREILIEGGKKARPIFAETTNEVADKMGIVRYV